MNGMVCRTARREGDSIRASTSKGWAPRRQGMRDRGSFGIGSTPVPRSLYSYYRSFLYCSCGSPALRCSLVCRSTLKVPIRQEPRCCSILCTGCLPDRCKIHSLHGKLRRPLNLGWGRIRHCRRRNLDSHQLELSLGGRCCSSVHHCWRMKRKFCRSLKASSLTRPGLRCIPRRIRIG
jgi:hypothetical protein